MWKYIRQYLPYAILAGLFMIGEVSMDLAQPGIMSQIVDDGVLGLNSSGVSDLTLILKLGLIMIGLVLFGGTLRLTKQCFCSYVRSKHRQ